MATTTLYRRPLAPRALQLQFPSYIPQQKTVRIAPMSTKRPHSPEVNGDSNAIQATPPKRARGIQPSSMQVSRDPRERELRKAQREERKAEFRVKYTRAFPSWVFYFDLDTLDPQSAASRRILENKVSSLGAVSLFVIHIQNDTHCHAADRCFFFQRGDTFNHQPTNPYKRCWKQREYSQTTTLAIETHVIPSKSNQRQDPVGIFLY